ncbi:hypothetical protein V1498_19970 [Peribacillus sp. SCS-26]|uniref:hypothetical protein n=1 Tax=Paraperibacillus marinus TaxID=3115295 RepID=UPI003905C1CE
MGFSVRTPAAGEDPAPFRKARNPANIAVCEVAFEKSVILKELLMQQHPAGEMLLEFGGMRKRDNWFGARRGGIMRREFRGKKF